MKLRNLIVFGIGAALLFGSGTLNIASAQKVRVGYVHVFDDAPIVVARDKGFFTAEGLDAQVTSFTSGPTLVKGLVSDQLDIGVLGFTNAVTWSAQGADLKIVGKVQEGFHSLLARGDRGIKTLKDLKGKSIASQSAGSTADIVLKGVVLKKAGLTEKDLQIMYTAPSTALASLRAGRVDSAFFFEPYDTVARSALQVRELYEVGKSWPFPCMVVTVPGKLIQEQPETVQKILASIRRSIEFMKSKPTEAAKVLAPAFMPEGEFEAEGHSVKPEEVMLKSLNSNKFDWRITQPDMNRMQELAGIMKGMDVLAKDVPISSIVDLRWQKELEKRK